MINRSALLGIAQKLLFRPKIIGSLIVAVVLCYQVGIEMVVKGQLEAVKKIDDTIATKTGDMEKQKDMVKRYSSLSESIKVLPLHLAELAKGESAKVKAASLASQIQDLIPKQASRPASESKVTQGASAAGLGLGGTPGAEANGKAPDTVGPLTLIDIKAKEPITQDVLASSFATALQPKLEGQVSSLKLWEFPYTLQLTGSTLDLVAFLNALVQMEPLVVITSVELKLDEKATPYLKYAHTPVGPGGSGSSVTSTANAGVDITVPSGGEKGSTHSVIEAGDNALDRNRELGKAGSAAVASLSPAPTVKLGKSLPLQFGSFAPGTEGGKLAPPKIEFKLPDVSMRPGGAKLSQGAPVVMLLEVSLFIQDKTLNP